MVDDVDEQTGAPDADEATVEPTLEDPAAALQRARRRKRQAWWLGLAVLAVGGAAWAVYAHWPLPTVRIHGELDITCPMKVGGEVSGDEDRRAGFPFFMTSPLPDDPGLTLFFAVDGAPGATVGIYAEVPDKPGWDATRCGRAACRIFADGELVFEGLSTAGQSLTCVASAESRSLRPPVSRPFARWLPFPTYDR